MSSLITSDKGVQPKVARATALEVKNTLQGQQMMFDAISDRFLAWHVMQQAKTCFFFFFVSTDFYGFQPPIFTFRP